MNDMDEPVVCPDCRCTKVRGENTSPWNSSDYCDACLLDRVKDGERVPLKSPPDAGDAEEFEAEGWFYHLCARCGGTGQVILTAWQPDTACFSCLGTGFDAAPARSVRRWQRWSATYQSNKVEEVKHRRRRT